MLENLGLDVDVVYEDEDVKNRKHSENNLNEHEDICQETKLMENEVMEKTHKKSVPLLSLLDTDKLRIYLFHVFGSANYLFHANNFQR